MSRIDDEASLERRLGKRPGAADVKVIDHVDAGAAAWIAEASLAAISVLDDRGIRIGLAGGARGFVERTDPATLRIRGRDLDPPATGTAPGAFGAILLVPGLRETLRINGRIEPTGSGDLVLRVGECFMHCGKALIRSKFWETPAPAPAPADPRGFAAATCLMLLGTASEHGADVSPKGDPGGDLVRYAGSEAWFAERPGNRRADGFRNILRQPEIAALLLLPGCDRVGVLTGRAELRDDDDLRDGFAVQGKVPLLVTRVAEARLHLSDSPALARADLSVRATPTLDPAAIMAGHVRLSRSGGLQASLARAVVTVPGLMRRGLASDYRRRLY